MLRRFPKSGEALFASCRDLQGGPSQCLLPPNKIIERLALAHSRAPDRFDWRTVDVRWPRCDGAIRDPGFWDDEPALQGQREFHRDRKKLGKDDLVALRPKIQAIFGAHGEKPPTSFRPAISRLERSDGARSVLAAAKRFYDRATNSDAVETVIKQFMDSCPPLRVLVYAMFIPWYNTAILRDYLAGDRLSAGNNDLFMSVYLPYCDWFVTDDDGQAKSLREVAGYAGLETEILSYDEFRGKFLATV